MSDGGMERVGVFFEVVDRASGPIAAIARAAEGMGSKAQRAQKQAVGPFAAMAKAAENVRAQKAKQRFDEEVEWQETIEKAKAKIAADEAKKAAKGTSDISLAAIMGGTELSPAQKQAAEMDRQVESNRKWAAQEYAEKSTIASSIILDSARILRDANASAAEKIDAFASMAPRVGVELSQFGGKLGMFGAKLAAAGPAFQVGMMIGGAIDEKFDLSGRISGTGKAHQREVAKANDEYARALGYRSSKEMVESRAVEAQTTTEIKLRHAAEERAKGLKRLPTNATEREELAWNANMTAQARQLATLLHIPIEDAYRALRDAAQNAALSLEEQAAEARKASGAATMSVMEQQSFNSRVRFAAAQIGAMPVDPTSREFEAVTDKLRRLGEDFGYASKMSEWLGATMGEVGNNLASRQASTAREITDQATFASEGKKMRGAARKAMRGGTAAALAFDAQLWKQADALAQAERNGQGGPADPARVDAFYRGLKAETLDKVKSPSFDFRGSKFDITQSFAEGFDPDRIAVTFANDLAALGERPLSSGFAPLMGSR